MLRKLLSSILFITSLVVISQTAFAQQGGLDTTWGINNTGIYQDALPALPIPAGEGDRSRGFGISEILGDGKIIVAGSATLAYINNNGNGGYASDFLVRRLNADGSVDTTFGTNGEARTTFYRWGAGSYERSDNPTYTMKVQPSDGKIILASMCSVSGTVVPNGTALGNDLCLVRYNSNGTLDTSFGGNTVFSYGGNQNYPGNNNTVDAGKVFTLTGVNTVTGRTDGFGGTPVKIQIAPDGRIYVFGNSRDDTPSRFKGFVAIYSTNGTLQTLSSLVDTTGNAIDGYGRTTIYDGDLLSNGDFVVVGSQTILVSSNPTVFSPARWKIFTGSSGGGFLESNVNIFGEARAITMLRSNKILVGGDTISNFGNPTLVRYNGDLTVDTTFGNNGRIVYDGTGNNTSIDTRSIYSLKTQPDGKIIGTTSLGNIFRLNANGSLDRSFARLREDVADSLSLRGILSNYRYTTPFPVVPGSDMRINFGGVSFRPNGKLVVSGSVGGDYTTSRAVVTQLKTSFRNGGTFSDFNNDGKAEIAAFRPSDGSWYQLDSFSGAFSTVQFGATGDKLAPADYDGDGRTDQAVFRNGNWYILQSATGTVRTVQWGSAGDLPLPADFNGDGQADIAIFRPSTGAWAILYSNPIQPGNVAYNLVQFGQLGDVPLMADFDGDGKSDIAVFRSGNWYYLRSSDGQLRTVQWGAAGDVPTAGDYDGDSQTDFAIFRNGNWYVLRSSDSGFSSVGWGSAGDKAVAADYDNDGKTDYAVYRNGDWYVLRSSDNGLTATNFGVASDIPVPAAYLP